jgi:hypothetical protein
MATDKGAEAAPFVRSPEALQPRLGNPPTKVA